jgi:cholesterol oxidase
MRLASPPSDLRDRYQIVVVGSGYGGGISASRLARAGQQVCVLERGREFQAGEFPDTELEGAAQSQATIPHFEPVRIGSPLALMDWHIEPDFNVLRGCGLGGTSLINANASLEADPKVFEDPRWPRELIADLDTRLRDGYRHAREVLEPRPYPDDWPSLPKLEAHARSAKRMGERFVRVPINVSFEDRTNAFGVELRKCRLCGDCVTGCNHSAKHTVAATYLPDAWNHGAEIFTQVRVDWLERRADGWAIHYTPVKAGCEIFSQVGARIVLADIVILAAGSMGSTEILLRSAARGLSLSARLGERFSGNADVIGFGYNTDVRINGVGAGARAIDANQPVGPTITSMIDGRTPARSLDEQWQLQDAALPGAIDSLLPSAFEAAADKWGTDTDGGMLDALAERARRLRSRLPDGARHGALRNTQTFLAMAVDSSSGKLELDSDDHLRIDWPQADREPIIASLNQRMLEATQALGGTFVPNPCWGNHINSALVTVHPLGGCSMASDAASGVTNHCGQVFCGHTGTDVHAGLYVSDGGVLPMAVGINPLLTISAIAERNVALLAEAHGWTIPYELGHRPAQPRLPASAPGIGVQFTERMAGFISPAVGGTHEDAHAAGRAANHRFAFVLTLSSEDLDATLDDPARLMTFDGTVDAPSLSSSSLQVTAGKFSLLSRDPEREGTTNMIYEMQLRGGDGRCWSFRGVKYVHDDRGVDLWSDTTTLYVDVHDQAGTLAARGILRIELDDFVKQLTTISITGTVSKLEQLRAKARFGKFFAGALFETYGDLFARPSAFDPDAAPRKRRPLRAAAPTIHYFFTSDGVQLCLSRYQAGGQGGSKGPVILCHGLGVSSRIFTVDTIETNLVEYLVAHGYDVWLLDYRSSIELTAAAAPANGDVIAAIDYPEAVAEVRRITGAASVQMVVHCFGSTVFFMSMLAGKLTGVRAAVASQTAAHVDAAGLVRLKSGLHVPDLLDALGVDTLDAYTDTHARWYERLYDRALELYPVARDEHCKSATCHRITFMYSLLYEHDQLALATHETLHELFGVAHVEAFGHLAAMVRAKQLVDAHGEDVYLPHPERLAIPLRIIHGAENACFDPSGTERTEAWLREHNDPGLVSRVVIPNYGHIDCIFGKRAAIDVYPHILAHLEAHL